MATLKDIAAGKAAAAAKAAEGKTESKEVATTNKGEVATISFSPAKFAQVKEDFVKANSNLGLDFVYIGQWLVINKKGQFIERDAPEVNYGDKMEVIIGAGEERFTLWGKENSAEQGTLLIAEKNEMEAHKKFDELVNSGAIDGTEYAYEDIQSRYVAQVIPVESMKDESPKIYILSFAPTSKFAFGKWAYNLFKGSFASQGFPKGTSVSQVVTELTTIEKTTDKFSYIMLDFKAVKMLS